jgi:hypothetical protein
MFDSSLLILTFNSFVVSNGFLSIVGDVMGDVIGELASSLGIGTYDAC